MGRSVYVGLEEYAVVFNLPQVFKAESLEPAAVGENRAIPPHELVQSP